MKRTFVHKNRHREKSGGGEKYRERYNPMEEDDNKFDAYGLILFTACACCVVSTSAALAYVAMGCTGIPFLKCAPTAVISAAFFACSVIASEDKITASCARFAGAAFALVSMGDALLETDRWRLGTVLSCVGQVAMVLAAFASSRVSRNETKGTVWRTALCAVSIAIGEVIAVCIARIVSSGSDAMASVPTVIYLITIGASGGLGASRWKRMDEAFACIVGAHALQLADSIAMLAFPGKQYLVMITYWMGCASTAAAPALFAHRQIKLKMRRDLRSIL